ncbi:VOC family protein [Nonomuraea sp. NPDC049309]|uniref:VOC family protein n=1 Tax=Nonomuraea sp. NPDC049309 TaxID=3364350 RepID=UPI0037143C4A
MALSVHNIVIDCESPPRLARFWSAAMGYGITHADERSARLTPGPGGQGPHLILVKVPERKIAKNRLHLDLAASDPEAEIRRLRELGATAVATRRMDELTWTVMRDPEGNEFCVG